MSVEDIQKVNKLAQDLLDQNMASSREDAVKQAQQILNKNIVERQKIDESGSIIVNEDFDYLKNLVIRSKEYTLQQLNEFKKQIETLTAEVNRLKAEIAASGSSKVKSAQESGLADQKTKQAAQQKLKDKKEEYNQRKGKFNPDDVAVDKIFYYGNK